MTTDRATQTVEGLDPRGPGISVPGEAQGPSSVIVVGDKTPPPKKGGGAKTPQSKGKGKGKRLRSSPNEVATEGSKKRLFSEAVASPPVATPKSPGPGQTRAPPMVGEKAGPSGEGGGGLPPPRGVGVAGDPGEGGPTRDPSFERVTRKKKKKKGKGKVPPPPLSGTQGTGVPGVPQKVGPKGSTPRQPPSSGKMPGATPNKGKAGTPRPGIGKAGAPPPTSAVKPRAPAAPPKKRARPVRTRPEAVLVRVPEGGQFIDTYRTTVTLGRAALTDVRAVKRTRLGHVLLELGPKVSSTLVASELVKLSSGKVSCTPLQDRTALEIRDIDPMVDAPALLEDLGAALKVEVTGLAVRSLRTTLNGTQTAVVEVPTTALPKGAEPVRFRTGLTVVRTRPLVKSTRCFACHQLGHLAAACPTVPKGKEMCRRCGALDHAIAVCKGVAKCLICSARGVTGPKAAHVTASLACPAIRANSAAGGSRSSRPGQ